MPYIKQEDRNKFDGLIYDLLMKPVSFDSPGELNYVISRIIHLYLERKTQGINYAKLNEVIGVLECAKQELYRQIAVPYEDKKKQENGPVSNLDKGGDIGDEDCPYCGDENRGD